MIINELKKIFKTHKSNYKINWKVPDLESELGEYFENDHTKEFLKKHGISFKTENKLLQVLKSGELIEISPEELFQNFENLTTPEEFKDEIKDTEYSKSFKSMQKALKSQDILTLPAPILLKIGTLYYGFAGNRRVNLALMYKIPIKFWVVNLKHFK